MGSKVDGCRLGGGVVVVGELGELVFDCFWVLCGVDVDGGCLHSRECVLHESFGDVEAVFWQEGEEVGCHESAVGVLG